MLRTLHISWSQSRRPTIDIIIIIMLRVRTTGILLQNSFLGRRPKKIFQEDPAGRKPNVS